MTGIAEDDRFAQAGFRVNDIKNRHIVIECILRRWFAAFHAFTPAVATDTDQQLSQAENDMKALAVFSDSITTVAQEDTATP